MTRTRILVVVVGAFLAAARPAAHDIPVDVLIQTFVKPEGQTLRLLVRAPLSAMRDAEFPLRGPGYLDLSRAADLDKTLRDSAVLWLAAGLDVFENGASLGKPTLIVPRVSLPSDRSFVAYDQALAHTVGRPLPASTELIWNQALLDVLFEFPITSDRSEFAINPTLARLGIHVVTTLRFLPPGGAVRAFEYPGDPGLVRLDPRWHQAAWRFVQLGFEHILSGTDHLLFLFCLVIPVRRFRDLVVVVTAFTVAHSITLIASAFGGAPDALWFPPLIEVLIAASIVWMALENIVWGSSFLVARGAPPPRVRPAALADSLSSAADHRWILAFAFGLVHGFGFSFALGQTMQFAGSHLLTSLLSFNIGVELGQLLLLAAMVPALYLLFRFVVAERVGAIILSAFIAHTAWHWLTERASILQNFHWPSFSGPGLVLALRWLMALVALTGGVWLVARRLARREDRLRGRT